MRKPLASILCCGVAALPLIGCAGSVTGSRQAGALPSVGVADNAPIAPAALVADAGRGIYPSGSAPPAAILVLLPPMGAVRGDDFLASNPALWTAQGFDVVTPQPPEIYQLVTDQQAALSRLLTAARALADAPVWLVGPAQAIETAIAGEPQIGGGPVSGVVVTSVASNGVSCSESVVYSDPGTGAAPKVTVRKSGNGCEAVGPYAGDRHPTIVPVPAQPRPKAPRIIEASASAQAGQEPLARRVGELIKASPPG